MLLDYDQKVKGLNPTMVIIFLNKFIITYVINIFILSQFSRGKQVS